MATVPKRAACTRDCSIRALLCVTRIALLRAPSEHTPRPYYSVTGPIRAILVCLNPDEIFILDEIYLDLSAGSITCYRSHKGSARPAAARRTLSASSFVCNFLPGKEENKSV